MHSWEPEARRRWEFKTTYRDFPAAQWLRLHASNAGVQVRILVRKLRSHIHLGQKTKTETRSNIVTNPIKILKMVQIKNFLKKKTTNPVYLVTSVTCGRNLDPGPCPRNRGGCFQVRQPLNRGVLDTLPLCCPQMLSSVCVFATPWTVACQAPLSMGLPREKYRGGLPLPSPGDLPNPGIEPASPASPASAGGVFTTGVTWEAHTSQRKLTDPKG